MNLNFMFIVEHVSLTLLPLSFNWQILSRTSHVKQSVLKNEEIFILQECIPVGCVSPAAVAVRGGGLC